MSNILRYGAISSSSFPQIDSLYSSLLQSPSKLGEMKLMQQAYQIIWLLTHLSHRNRYRRSAKQQLDILFKYWDIDWLKRDRLTVRTLLW